MVTQGATGDVNVRIQLDESAIPDFGGKPPKRPVDFGGPPPPKFDTQTGVRREAPPMPKEILSMFAKDMAAEKGFAPPTQEQKEQLAVLKESLAIQNEAKEYSRYFTEEGDERKSTFQTISSGIKESGMFQKVASSKMGKGLGTLLGGISKLGGPLGMIAGGIGGMLLNTKVMKAGIGGLTSIISAFFDVLMAPLMPLIARGLQSLAKLIPWLQKFMNDPFGELSKLLAKTFNWLADLPLQILGSFIEIPEEILQLHKDTKEAYAKAFGGVKDAWDLAWAGAEAAWQGNWSEAATNWLGVFTGLAGTWIELFTGIAAAWLNLFAAIAPDWMKPWLTSAADWLELFGTTSADWLDKFPKIAGDWLEKFDKSPEEFLKNWNETPDKWHNLWTAEPAFWTQLWDDIPGTWKNLFWDTPRLLVGLFSGSPAAWNKLWEKLPQDFKDLFQPFTDWRNLFVAQSANAWAQIVYFFQDALDKSWLGGLVDTPTKPLSMEEFTALWKENLQNQRNNADDLANAVNTYIEPFQALTGPVSGMYGRYLPMGGGSSTIRVVIESQDVTEQAVVDLKNEDGKGGKYEITWSIGRSLGWWR